MLNTTKRWEKIFEFYRGRLNYRFAYKGLTWGDPLLILDALHWMQLGQYQQYDPCVIKYDRLPRLRAEKLPSIAIVTPSYYQGKYLETTMRSVLSQNYPSLEYAVVDGGSTDGSLEIIRRYSDRLFYAVSERDDGQSDAIVKGFRHVSGEIQAYLNSDDMLAPGTLRYVGAFFAVNPGVDAVYGHRIIVNEEGLETGRWILPQHDAESTRFFDAIPQETLFWRKRIYEKVGGICPDFHFAMDWDLILRFQAAGANIRRLPYFLACFRAHAGQKSQAAADLGLREIKRLLRREGGDPEFGASFNNQKRAFHRRAMLSTILHSVGIRA